MQIFRVCVYGVLALASTISIAGGVSITIDDIAAGSLEKNYTPVNFIGPGNDFGGGIVWLTNKKLPNPISINDDISCSSQIRGLYFNSQRGERLWPLDNDTAKDYSILDDKRKIAGGRYTDCTSSSSSDNKKFVEYSVFGLITYTYNDDNAFNLIAGAKLNYNTNTYSPSASLGTHNFQYINNITPAGYIYDTAGGIAFVGARITQNGSIDQVIRDRHEKLIGTLNDNGYMNKYAKYANNKLVVSALGSSNNTINVNQTSAAVDTKLGIGILGTIGIGRGYDASTKRSILGNPGAASSISEISSINASDRYNTARKNAQKLCRGRQKTGGRNEGTGKIICISGQDAILHGNTLRLLIKRGLFGTSSTVPNDINITNKSIYIRDGTLAIVKGHTKENAPVDIFVDGGTVELIAKGPLIPLSSSGFPVSSNGATEGLFLRGNLLVNGSIYTKTKKDRRAFSVKNSDQGVLGGRSGGSFGIDTLSYQSPQIHKFYLHGKFLSLNHIAKPSTKRGDRLQNTKTLSSVFTRRCDPKIGEGGDGKSCKDPNDEFALVPFAIIDQQYPSRFLTK